MRLQEVLTVQEHARGFVGQCHAGRATRIFGGHTLAHALVAASRRLDHTREVSSLHALFLAPGDTTASVYYVAHDLKRGRSFDVVRVAGTQDMRQVVDVTVSFHDGEPSSDYHSEPPHVVSPHELVPDPPRPGANPVVREPFDIRTVPSDRSLPKTSTWIRSKQSLADAGTHQHKAALAYAIDFLITHTAHNPLDESAGAYLGASLDHAMWFHQPFCIDDWLLIHTETTAFIGARSLSHSQIFNQKGGLVASATQEALLRPPQSAEQDR